MDFPDLITAHDPAVTGQIMAGNTAWNELTVEDMQVEDMQERHVHVIPASLTEDSDIHCEKGSKEDRRDYMRNKIFIWRKDENDGMEAWKNKQG